MSDNFTESAVNVVLIAQEEARSRNLHTIGSELLLLGLCTQSGIAEQALHEFGISEILVKKVVEEMVELGTDPSPEEIPFTANAQKIIENAGAIVTETSDKKVDTEHLLLALLEEPLGRAPEVMQNLGVPRQELFAKILQLMQEKKRVRARNKVMDVSQGDIVLMHVEPIKPNNKAVIAKNSKNSKTSSSDSDEEDESESLLRRPMVIVSANNRLNKMHTVFAVPLYAHSKFVIPHEFDVPLELNPQEANAAGLRSASFAACWQLTSFSRDKVVTKLSALPKESTNAIIEMLSKLIQSE